MYHTYALIFNIQKKLNIPSNISINHHDFYKILLFF